MNSFSLCSFMAKLLVFSGQPSAFADNYLIQDTRTIRIDWFLLRVERRRRLAALAEADPAAGPGPQAVIDHEVFAIGMAGPQCFETERDADEPAGPGERRMSARQRH